MFYQRSGRDRGATELERAEAASPGSLDLFLFETPSRVHPTTWILSHSSFALVFTMTPEQPSGFPQAGGRFAVVPATVTHAHSRCAAAMVEATPVRGTGSREKILPERPKPLAPAVPAMQAPTARACSCFGGGELAEKKDGMVVASIRICARDGQGQ